MSQIIDRRLPGEAFAWVDCRPLPQEVENLSLNQAAGRILGRAIPAADNIPARRTAAADGFALRAADTFGAGDYSPLPFNVRPAAQRLASGEAVPVAHGAPMPEAADVVLPIELADVRGGILDVVQAQVAGERVAETGEEYGVGDLLLPAGRRLRPADLALLALAGCGEVPVWRQPVVRILMAGRPARDADSPMLESLVRRDGGRIESVAVAADGAALGAALARPGADLVLVAGATGEGEADHAVASLRQAGVLAMHRVAIHPGGNLALGEAAGAAVILLPGTPLACFSAYDLVAARLLRRLARLPGAWPYRADILPLRSKLTSSIGRLELCRVRVRDGLVEPLAVTDERKLSTVVKADGCVLVPEDSEGYGPGVDVLVHLYD